MPTPTKEKSGWKPNWPVFIRTFISVRFERWRPRLRVSERFEPIIKWASRILAALGVISSIFVFPAWYYALGFAIVVFALQQFVEKALFVYTTMFVQPLPEFEVDPKQWTGMGYAYPEPPAPNKPYIAGPAFASLDYAAKFMDLMMTWNYAEHEDRDNNICFSIILEDGGYAIYIYPNTKRRTAQRAHAQGEALKRGEKRGREHQSLIIHMVFCKWFPYTPASQSRRFIETQSGERPFWFQMFQYEDGKLSIAFDIKPILKWDVKIKQRADLEPGEFEYTFMNRGRKPMKP